MMSFADDCRVGFLEPGSLGRWTVERFEVTEEDAKYLRLQAIFGSSHRGYTPPGQYTRLDRHRPNGGSTIVMSDTSDELRDLAPLFWARPYGRVLVNGLGLGCALSGLLKREEVEHIDVVEIDPEVIQLVGSQFTDPRLTIHQGDAFTFEWPKGSTWDFAWHDVWDELSTDNLSDEENATPGTYARLNRRYGRRAGWQGAWGQGYLQVQRGRSRW